MKKSCHCAFSITCVVLKLDAFETHCADESCSQLAPGCEKQCHGFVVERERVSVSLRHSCYAFLRSGFRNCAGCAPAPGSCCCAALLTFASCAAPFDDDSSTRMSIFSAGSPTWIQLGVVPSLLAKTQESTKTHSGGSFQEVLLEGVLELLLLCL